MKIIINHSSMIPIYEQIVEQVKALIRNGKLKENDNLPSVTATNTELLLEEQKKELESDLERVIQKGRCYGISDEDIKKLFELILEG